MEKYKAIQSVIKGVRPDLPDQIISDIGLIINSLLENNVDPALIAMNVAVMGKIYDENPGIKFKMGEVRNQRNIKIQTEINFNIGEVLEYLDINTLLEISLINECVGEINLSIDQQPSDKELTLWSKGLINNIWKTQSTVDTDGSWIPEKIYVSLNYGLSYE